MANKPTIEQLQSQIADLQRELYRISGKYIGPVERTPPVQRDHVAHGSDQHAALLGLRKATEKDKFQSQGWALEDVTLYGPAARDDYIQMMLEQKVSELTAPIPVPQSDDPRLPNWAPKMWEPK
jgi:hypothetical protein